jgi:diguanylate cyclase (GGDEF)-like protein
MQKVAILYDVSQAVLSTFDLDEVLSQILMIAKDYFRVENCAILLLDPTDQKLKVRKEFGGNRIARDIAIPLGKGIIGSSAKRKLPIYVPDVSKDPRYIKTFTETRCELAIPLVVRDEVYGVLDFQSVDLDYFDKDTIDLLTLFSTQASIALANARLYSKEQRQRAQLEAINAIADQISKTNELGDLLQKICSLIPEKFPVDHAILILREGEPDEQRLLMRAHAGRLTPLFSSQYELPPGDGLCRTAYHRGEVVVDNHVRSSERYIPGFKETCSELCLPLIAFQETLGVLVLESAQLDAFQEQDIRVLQSVADICAIGIRNAMQLHQAKTMASTDGLTGIYNRRGFETRILEEIAGAQRNGLGVSLLIIDIDHFKRLNDEFGHLLGDEVLRQVAKIFTQQIRKNDVVCRYGGEEFAILLPETTTERAAAVADKLRRVVADFQFPGVPRPVTISLGVADCPTHAASRDDLVRAADEAMYAAKQNGRNRIETAQQTVAKGVAR